MARKDSFILYTEQKAVLDKLTDEQAGKLIKAIYEYEATGTMPVLDAILDLVIIPFKTALDKNENKWEDTKQKRSEAGKIGAEKRWNNKIAKIANAKSANSKIAKIAVNDNVNVNVNDNVLTTTVVNNASDSCVDGLQKIIDFYNNNIGLLPPYGLEVFQDYLKEMDYQVIIFAMKKAVEANVRTIQYIKGTLNNWSKAGIKTLIEAQEESQKFKNSRQEETKVETEEEKMARRIKELEEMDK